MPTISGSVSWNTRLVPVRYKVMIITIIVLIYSQRGGNPIINVTFSVLLTEARSSPIVLAPCPPRGAPRALAPLRSPKRKRRLGTQYIDLAKKSVEEYAVWII